MNKYGSSPVFVGQYDGVDLKEVMYYLYLPVQFPEGEQRSRNKPKETLYRGFDERRIPKNLEVTGIRVLIADALRFAVAKGRDVNKDYVYVSARKGWATPDNPLNRPGWHCDGFGTNDMNFVWWDGPGTRFAVGEFSNISDDHIKSLAQFEEQINKNGLNEWCDPGLIDIIQGKAHGFYYIDPFCVHSTPLIDPPGCMRQYIKISLSTERYNLENNSHNYDFNYNWEMHGREVVRNDTYQAARDYFKP